MSNPKLISDPRSGEEISRLSFSNDKTEAFFDWLMDKCLEHPDNPQSILEQIQNSNFRSLYNTKVQNYVNYAENGKDVFEYFLMLCDRHKLERLKIECLNLLKSPDLKPESRNASIEMYKKEIAKLASEINAKMSPTE